MAPLVAPTVADYPPLMTAALRGVTAVLHGAPFGALVPTLIDLIMPSLVLINLVLLVSRLVGWLAAWLIKTTGPRLRRVFHTADCV